MCVCGVILNFDRHKLSSKYFTVDLVTISI